MNTATPISRGWSMASRSRFSSQQVAGAGRYQPWRIPGVGQTVGHVAGSVGGTNGKKVPAGVLAGVD